MNGTGGNLYAVPRKLPKPIPREHVETQALLLSRFTEKLAAGELTAGPVGRAYLEGALAALREVLGEGQWQLPDDLAGASDTPLDPEQTLDRLQDTND